MSSDTKRYEKSRVIWKWLNIWFDICMAFDNIEMSAILRFLKTIFFNLLWQIGKSPLFLATNILLNKGLMLKRNIYEFCRPRTDTFSIGHYFTYFCNFGLHVRGCFLASRPKINFYGGFRIWYVRFWRGLLNPWFWPFFDSG